MYYVPPPITLLSALYSRFIHQVNGFKDCIPGILYFSCFKEWLLQPEHLAHNALRHFDSARQYEQVKDMLFSMAVR